jgi:mono/diheme cytochrome c family protein
MLKPATGLLLGLVAVLAVFLATSISRADDPRAGLDYFEREVRPILVDACQKCHGPDKQESDLRLDSRTAALKGGASGVAIVPGQPEKSLLIEAIRHTGDITMPPQAKLTEAQIAAITHWVKLGAPWPNETTAAAKANGAAQTHWAFQPVRDPPVSGASGGRQAPDHVEQPAAVNHREAHASRSPNNPIDAFIRSRLVAEGLTPSPPADRRTLIRRATFGLTGLPPTPDDVEAFERDTDPRAYENLIQRLLTQPQYGEHWGRHWLDVARYSDTKGYVYAREQRFWVHAWVYRDWVASVTTTRRTTSFCSCKSRPKRLTSRRWLRGLSHARPPISRRVARDYRRPHRRGDAGHDGPDRRLCPLPRSQVRPDSDPRLLFAVWHLSKLLGTDDAGRRAGKKRRGVSEVRRRIGESS